MRLQPCEAFLLALSNNSFRVSLRKEAVGSQRIPPQFVKASNW